MTAALVRLLAAEGIAHAVDGGTVVVAVGDWVPAARLARTAVGPDAALLDHLTGVDETDDATVPGVDVVLRLWAVDRRVAVQLRTRALLPDLVLPTLTSVLPGAAWPERELAEMFGITVVGHPDPRPLLLPDGFGAHPLRKDFVLASRVVRPWPGAPEPGESTTDAQAVRPRTASRRRARPLGVPEGWAGD